MPEETQQPNRLRELRKAKGMSLDAVAERANTSAQQISRLERGIRRMTFDWADRLAPILDCEPSELMSAGQDLPEDERMLLDVYRRLDEPGRDVVYRLALMLRPVEPEISDDERALIDDLRDLPERDRQAVLNLAHTLRRPTPDQAAS